MSATDDIEGRHEVADPVRARGFPDEWAHASALRDLQRAQRRAGQRLAAIAYGLGIRPPAVDWLLDGAPVDIRDRGTLAALIDDVLAALESGAEATAILRVLDELAALGSLHLALDRADDRAVLQLCEIVNAHEAACGRRHWQWELRRRDRMMLEARWDRDDPPAWWACGVTSLVIDDGRPVDERLRPWGTLWVTPKAAARTLAEAELWLADMADEAERSAQS